MRIEVKGYAQDSDVDFILLPDTNAEKVLLKAMRGRDSVIVFQASGADTISFRAIVKGRRA